MKNNKMKIASSSFYPYQYLPSRHTCEGENVNPYLKVYSLPENTKSIVLIIKNRKSGFVHWAVFDIVPTGDSLEIYEDEIPTGIQAKNDSGHNYYEGPCPSQGEKEYSFKVYALDKMLGLDETSKANGLEKEMEGHIIDEVEMIGKYKKQN